MRTSRLLPLAALLLSSALVTAPLLAQETAQDPPPPGDIDFGDDSSRWANDGECDDPRFAGEGMARVTNERNVMADATDCRTAFEAGTVTLAPEEPSAPRGDATPEATPPVTPAPDEATPAPDAAGIDFGNDTGRYANDDECDDPRFDGPGASVADFPDHLRADASDCRAALEAGTVDYLGETVATDPAPAPPPPQDAPGDTGPAAPLPGADIDFGDDSGRWALDGECDDPRFEGPSTGAGLTNHERADATDCRTAVEAGTATLIAAPPAADPVPPTPPAVPQPDVSQIGFGDDSGRWALDGECDDPRFAGEGSGQSSLPDHLRADATDCRAAYVEGTVTYLGENPPPPEVDIPGQPTTEQAPPTDVPQPLVSEIGFGDDSGDWANDNECDDPRFTGPGASSGFDDHLRADATDCRAAYEAGTVTWVGDGATTAPTTDVPQPPVSEIGFGDDSGNWANDNECDDPRFTGPGASGGFEDHIRADATDCRTAYEAGTVTWLGNTPPAAPPAPSPTTEQAPPTDVPQPPASEIDFGNDDGTWANDNQCDDPRFTGPGASSGFDSHLRLDATDCREAYAAGTVTWVGQAGAAQAPAPDGPAAGAPPASDIVFGTDTGRWANDGECDDPRFTGSGASGGLQDHLRADATDCREAYEAGTVTLVPGAETGSTPTPPIPAPRPAPPATQPEAGDIDFGTDQGAWANDGECDDPRFAGPGMAAERQAGDEGLDATDCRTLFEAGRVQLAHADGSSTLDLGIDFGDDSSRWANDGECDDPRFTGSNMSPQPIEADRLADATDCRTLYESGAITLIDTPSAGSATTPPPANDNATTNNTAGIDFGDDSSRWANDGECDDPRFAGEGMSRRPIDSDRMADATDCRTLFEAGRITLAQ